MNKRLILLIAALSAALTAAPGCSVVGGLSPTATPDPTPLPTLAHAADPTSTAAPRQIVQLIPYQSFDPHADQVAVRLGELTGYELIFVTLPEEGALEQISIELSVGVEYDLITLTPAQFGKLAGKGALTALDGLMAQYAPALQAVYTADEWRAAAVGGQILGIPRFGARYVDEGLVLDGTVAGELGITAPASPDELREALQTVKREIDLIPLTGSGYRLTAVMSGFGLNTQWHTDGVTFTNWIESEAFREYLTYMAGLYEDGLVDTGWAENTAESAAAKQDAGEAFAMVRDGDDRAALAGGHAAMIVAPLADGGVRTYGVSAAPESFVAVPATCADPVKVMDYLHIRAQTDNILIAAVGVEGVQYETRGGAYLPLDAFSDWRNAPVFAVAIPTGLVTDLWLCGVREDGDAYAAYTALNESMALVIEPVSYAPVLDAVENFSGSLDAIVNEFFVQVMTGEKTVQKDYTAFVNRWMADGGEMMIEAYARWKYGTAAEDQ